MGKNLIFILLVVVFSRCLTATKLVHGSKEPKIESEFSITKWLKKKGFVEGQICSVSPEEYYFFAPRFVNSIFLFDKNGRFLSYGYHQGKFCVKDVDKILKDISPIEHQVNLPDSFIVSQYYELTKIENVKEKSKEELDRIVNENLKIKRPDLITDTLFLNYFFVNSKLRTLNGKKIEDDKISQFDYTLILPFAKYEGNWIQVSELRKYYNAAVTASKSKIQVVFLNLDKQAWWGNEWNEKIKIMN